MKFAIATLALATIASAATAGNATMQSSSQSQAEALDIGKLLGGLKPLLKKGKCVAPCIFEQANALQCDENGPLSTVCGNIDSVMKECEGAIKKCGIDKSTSGTVTKVLKDMCSKSKY
ncbi:hypothetical protein CP533_1506 [Ophiocordyceps camponoti-saundersi (nom. inval.)]|nr:hypothetical protein CP533_1506 [Ophiocordyceps camponoti-saundersi (nom. inval.)]